MTLLVAQALAASGNSEGQAAPDAPNKSLPVIQDGKIWPTAYLPSGMPQFPAGEFTLSGRPGDLTISIKEIPKGVLEAYGNALKNSGWKISAGHTGGVDANHFWTDMFARKGGWILTFVDYYGYTESGEEGSGGKGRYVSETSSAYLVVKYYDYTPPFGTPAPASAPVVKTAPGWPPKEHMPDTLPLYPEGRHEWLYSEDNVLIIRIYDSSRQGIMAYADTLKNAGWSMGGWNDAMSRSEGRREDGWNIRAIWNHSYGTAIIQLERRQ
jgi:hypothetical protein